MRRGIIVACALGVAVLGGVVVSKISTSADAQSRPASTEQTNSNQSGLNDTEVIPPGRSDEDQVRDAAVRAVALTDDVFAARFISRRELIETFTTDSFGPVLADETSQQATNLIFELGDRDIKPSDLSMVEQPLTSNVLSISSTEASVNVWSVLVIVAPGAGPARQVWRTVTVDLQLVDGEWLVEAWNSTSGPTPALASEVSVSDSTDTIEVVEWVHLDEAER
jgi:hypothetical protein